MFDCGRYPITGKTQTGRGGTNQKCGLSYTKPALTGKFQQTNFI